MIKATGDIVLDNTSVDGDATKSALGLFTQSFYRYGGTLEGTTNSLETLREDIRPWGGMAKVRMTFSGTVGGHEPGVFTAILTGIYNPSLEHPRPFRSTFHIVPGSGYGGLSGICGEGEIIGEEPANGEGRPTAVYDFEISFEKACEP